SEYKYIRNFEDGPKVYLPLDIHRSKAGQDVRKNYYVTNTKEELYYLKNDPLEQHNLIEEAEYREIAQVLRCKVKKWMFETNDPLLNGKVPGIKAPGWQ